MKKDVGSIFPIDLTYSNIDNANSYSSELLTYSLCREALYDIAVSLNETNKTVLIPTFTCQTVIAPFEEAGWSCHFFGIREDLRLDINHLLDLVDRIEPALIVVHPYFGMDLNEIEIEALKLVNRTGTKIIIDLTQCIFSNRRLPFANYYTGSYRKWFPIPDGGFLYVGKDMQVINQPKLENTDFVVRQTDAMFLRGLYFRNGDQRVKDISIRLNKLADHIADSKIVPHKMSSFSINLKQTEDEYTNQRVRLSNYKYLNESIEERGRIKKVCHRIEEVTTAPLYFPIYVKERRMLQTLLAEEHVYAPVIWPVEDEKVLINEKVKYIYNHLLAIPCDQRYGFDDLARAVKVINKFSE